MARTISTDWFADYLKNELTPGTVVLLRAWIAEACRINGDNFSATYLAESLARYVVLSMDEEDLGKAPRESAPLPTPEDMAAAIAKALASELRAAAA